MVRPRPGVGFEPCLVGLEGCPIDETRMVIGDENRPLGDRQMTHPFLDGSVFIDVAFRSCLAVGISASIHRIGEDVMERSVGRRDPADRTVVTAGIVLQREGQPFGAEPKPYPASGTELGEAFKDSADRVGDGLIGMEQYFAILFSPNEAHRYSATKLAACRLVADAAVEPGANDMQFCFTHRALQAQQQAVVEQCWMIDPILVTDERIGNAAQLQQAIPVRIVSGQTRDFQSQDNADVRQGHFIGEASEPGAFVDAGAGQAEVLINDDYLLSGPTELTGAISQGVLAGRGFAILLDLSRRGLANVNQSYTLGVGWFDFGGISHGFAPGSARLGWPWQEGAPASR